MNNQLCGPGLFKKVEICGFTVWVRAGKISGSNDVLIAEGPLRDEYGLDRIAHTGFPVKCVLDIGAFVGTFSMKAKRLWPNAKVLAFEPSPESARLYRLNTMGLTDVVFYEAAAVRRGQPETVHLIANNNFHAARRVTEVIAQFGERGGVGEPVKAVALVEALKTNGNPNIAILKIDAEGVEADLLEDLKDIGYLDRINWICGEWHFYESIDRIEAALHQTHNFRIHKDKYPWGGFEAVRKSIAFNLTSPSSQKEFSKTLKRNMTTCGWKPHSQYSVFTQFDGPTYYLPRKKLFLHKYRYLFSLAKTIAPSKLIELGTAAGSSADAYLSGSRDVSTINCEYVGMDLFGDLETAQKLFVARKFTNFKFIKCNFRKISELELADMVVVDGSHDFYNSLEDLKLAMTASPKWVFIDDIDGPEVASAWIRFRELFGNRIEWSYKINYIGGGLIVRCQ